MRAIQIKTLPATMTQCLRLQAATDEKCNGKIVVVKNGSFFPEKIAAGSDEDQASYLAEKFLTQLGWDKDNKYRLVCSSFKGAYYFTMVFK